MLFRNNLSHQSDYQNNHNSDSINTIKTNEIAKQKTKSDIPNQRHRTPFTLEEDQMIQQLVNIYGDHNWATVAANIPNRTVRQCRERWQLFLNSGVKKGKWTKEEDEILRKKYAEHGSQWKYLENFFEGRTSYNIRNRWISLEKKDRKYLMFSNASQLELTSPPIFEFQTDEIFKSEVNQETPGVVNDIVQKTYIESISCVEKEKNSPKDESCIFKCDSSCITGDECSCNSESFFEWARCCLFDEEIDSYFCAC
ncbi:Myb-like DNA-binding domain containing protein [Tritrichomonas foetus]|uniref:Myb-like DNA-binding domain containing protein n=1 Tax=Tritrichomonas foetus TaxID=1144522 RepID=A0A1J4K1C7_9EUKA|nr:Myb-like DNA-binding domain containing protein [Tritrichomonas foetus]|eukprot:OHT03548.1 Myb-like DNA-binding domain containing protein [Tritrichomonas foetus]